MITDGRLEVAGGVSEEHLITVGRVKVAGCIIKERLITGGRIAAVVCVAEERIKPIAVLSAPVLFKSVSSPRIVLLFVKHPS